MVRKLALFAFAFCLLALPGSAPADQAQTFAGNNTNGPLWNRPIGGGPGIGASVHRHVQRFKLTDPAECLIVGAQDFDGYLHLYQGSFNPNNQLANLIDGDDDAELGIGTSRIPADLNDNSVSLAAGTYFLVTSGFSESAQGAFQNSVHCNGNVQPIHGSCAATFAGFDPEEEICLQDRFLAVVNWSTANNSGKGTPVRTGSTDTGMFWFFSDRNWEVMIKVLNGCPLNGHWWVFIGALTNQGYTVSVADTTTLEVNGYTNVRPNRSPAFADTTAFPCP